MGCGSSPRTLLCCSLRGMRGPENRRRDSEGLDPAAGPRGPEPGGRGVPLAEATLPGRTLGPGAGLGWGGPAVGSRGLLREPRGPAVLRTAGRAGLVSGRTCLSVL